MSQPGQLSLSAKVLLPHVTFSPHETKPAGRQAIALLLDWSDHVKRCASDGQPEKHVGQILYFLIFDTACGTHASANSTQSIAVGPCMRIAAIGKCHDHGFGGSYRGGASRNTLLGISQVIMLTESVVNRALDRLASSE
jgi:hypothetical protein